MKTDAAPLLHVAIDRIRVEGAPAALRDTAAFSRILDQALSRALGTIDPDDAANRELPALTIRVAPGAGTHQIAEAVAGVIARAVRGG